MAGYQGTGTRFDDTEGQTALMEDERREHNGPVPGKVVSYDAATQTATVQPLLTQDFDGQKVRAPELQKIQVQVPQMGGLTIHAPLKAGDPVMLHPAMRSMDQHGEDGSDIDRYPGRMSNLGDSYAVPMPTAKPDQMSGLPSDRLHIGTKDGHSGFQMKDDGTFDIKAGGESLATILVDFMTAFKNHTGMSAGDQMTAQALIDRATAMKAS